ncbi:major capsid protein [Clostridioides sp. ES-W-0016-02]|uniref:major capsid protein n=1 Tax=Clostridioides sp. ES-W-0016-02 TaxID=2770788 RepID=UPI001D10DF2B|nr:major capsid protein [Clostridioides sp. ES-W-0016-02]
MPKIYDSYNNKSIAEYYKEAVSNKIPYLGETLFPYKKKLGLDLKYIKSGKGIPQVLKLSAFDTKATLRDRAGFSDVESEMPYFKESMLIKEKDRQELLKVIENDNSEYANIILNNIFDDTTHLVEGALHQFERMRMQLLSEGKIKITYGGLGLDYSYGVNETTVSKSWALPSTDIMADIEKGMDDAEDRSGVRPTRAICTKKTFKYLTENTKIIGAIRALNTTKYVNSKMVKQYIQDELDLTIAIYNKKYIDEDGATQNFFSDDVFTLIPASNLGSSWFGTTPEETDLMSSKVANVSIINTGVAITTKETDDPVNVSTKVSFIGLPSFENSEQVQILKVVTV